MNTNNLYKINWPIKEEDFRVKKLRKSLNSRQTAALMIIIISSSSCSYSKMEKRNSNINKIILVQNSNRCLSSQIKTAIITWVSSIW